MAFVTTSQEFKVLRTLQFAPHRLKWLIFSPTFHVRDKTAGIYRHLRPRSSLHLRFVREAHFSMAKCPALEYASANANVFYSTPAKVRLAVFPSLCRPQKHADIISKSTLLSKGVGLHYTASRDVNPAELPIATQYRQLSMRKSRNDG